MIMVLIMTRVQLAQFQQQAHECIIKKKKKEDINLLYAITSSVFDVF